jgi:hypothetical protein
MGTEDHLAYSDALLLLERGADPNRSAANGVTLGKMLNDYRRHFHATHKPEPAEFVALWNRAQQHGVIEQGQ